MRFLFFVFAAFSFITGWTQDTTRLSVLFTGDIMQHDSQIAAAYIPEAKSYNYASCFNYVNPVLQSADLTIGNLEVTLGGTPYKGYPQFSAPDELATQLKISGFDVLVTANNHCVDRGRKGLERTIAVLDTLGLLHTGTFVDSLKRKSNYPLVIEKNGVLLSLLNYTYGTNGIPVVFPNVVNLIDTLQMKKDLASAREQKTDVIIVFMHWGNEYQSLPNSFQKKIASLCFREGAKVVIGAHPHVLQPMEWRKEHNQLIAYSLGNFVSGQRPRYRDGGAMLWVDFEKITNDSVSTTTISDAKYELQWIHKTSGSRSEFFILPVKQFEADTIVVNTPGARAALTTFKADSRALLEKHNINIREFERQLASTIVPADTVYRICLIQTEATTKEITTGEVIEFYGLESEVDTEGNRLWLVGKFFDTEVAEQALNEIRTKTIYKDAYIRKTGVVH